MNQKETSDIELVVKSAGFKKSLYLHKFILAGGAKEFAKLLPSKESLTIDLDILFPPQAAKGKQVPEENREEQQEQEPTTVAWFTRFIVLLYGEEFNVDKSIPDSSDILKTHIEETVALYRLSSHFKATTLLESFESVFLEFAERFSSQNLVYVPGEDLPPTIMRGDNTSPFLAPPAKDFVDSKFSSFVSSFAIPVLMSAILARSRKVQAVYSRLFESVDWVLLNNQALIKGTDMSTFIDIFSDDLLLVDDEYVVFDCATKWLEAHSNQYEVCFYFPF